MVSRPFDSCDYAIMSTIENFAVFKIILTSQSIYGSGENMLVFSVINPQYHLCLKFPGFILPVKKNSFCECSS